jgi:hypothetical protein
MAGWPSWVYSASAQMAAIRSGTRASLCGVSLAGAAGDALKGWKSIVLQPANRLKTTVVAIRRVVMMRTLSLDWAVPPHVVAWLSRAVQRGFGGPSGTAQESHATYGYSGAGNRLGPGLSVASAFLRRIVYEVGATPDGGPLCSKIVGIAVGISSPGPIPAGMPRFTGPGGMKPGWIGCGGP